MKIDIILSNSAPDYTIVQDETSNGKAYYIANGRIYSQEVVLTNGDWTSVSFKEPAIVSLDTSVKSLAAASVPGVFEVLVWHDGSTHRVAVSPDEGPLYGPNSLNRFYFGVDTDKLYINIEDTWQVCATTDHNKLKNVGTLSHDELETEINNLKALITTLIK